VHGSSPKSFLTWNDMVPKPLGKQVAQWFTAILSDNQSCMQWSLPKNPQITLKCLFLWHILSFAIHTDILEIYNKLQHSTLTANKLSPQQSTQSHHARAWTF
jgi:hypothetical protein